MNEDRVCPYCQGTAYVLGNLGQTIHYRCQDCGIQFSASPKAFKLKPKADAKRQAKDRREAIKAKEKLQKGE